MAFCIFKVDMHRIAMGVMQMKCAWEPLLNLLPLWMRDKVNRLGKETMRELRFRINAPPELVLRGKSVFLERLISKEDIELIINLATQ